jgi:hypothetical protein
MSSLTENEKRRITELYNKLKEKNLNRNEAEEYQQLIERNKEEAQRIGDMVTFFGLILLGAALIMYVSSLDS